MRSVLIRATSALLVSALVLFSVAAAKPSSHPTDFVDDATGVAVNFQGSSPSFTFYPSAADNSTWLKVRFGKVMEVDANDEGVSGHRVASLSSLDATFTFGTELVDGSNYTWVRLAFNKTMLGNSFKYDECPDLAGGVRRLQQTADMDLAVKVMFGFTGATTFAYGFGNTIDVPQGGLKFNIEGAAWPFCDTTNRLLVQVHLASSDNGASNNSALAQAGDSKVATIPMSGGATASLSFPGFAYDDVNGTVQIPVKAIMKTPLAVAAANETVEEGTAAVVELTFDSYSTLYYDPVVTQGQSEHPQDFVTSDGMLVAFRGNSPQFAVYPDPADNTTYVRIRFGKVVEVDATGKEVQGHKINSLAALTGIFAYGNETADGAEVSFATLTITADQLKSSFQWDKCPGNTAPAMAGTAGSAISLGIKAVFGFTKDTTYPYGAASTITVPAGSLKFNLEGADWPFCDVGNSLRVELQIGTASGGSVTSLSTTSGTTTTSISMGGNAFSDLSFPSVAYDSVSGSTAIPVTATVNTGADPTLLADADPDTKVTIDLLIGAYSTLYYDPTVVTGVASTGLGAAAIAGIVVGVVAAVGIAAAAIAVVVLRARKAHGSVSPVKAGIASVMQNV